VEFVLPSSPSGNPWCTIIDTENIENPFVHAPVGDTMILDGRSVKLLSDEAFHPEEPSQLDPTGNE
jgi:isoamylase